MSDHEELADEQQELVERLDRENERVGEGADAARSKLDEAYSDEMVPHALGDEDPARREDERLQEGDEPVTADPASIDDDAREGERESGDDLAAAEGPQGDETDDDAEKPADDEGDRGDETPGGGGASAEADDDEDEDEDDDERG
jgi:hypothetical protein